MTSSPWVDVSALFSRFAGDVGATSARPLPDGTVSLDFGPVARLTHGSVLFNLPTGIENARVSWIPAAALSGGASEGGARLSSSDLSEDLLAILGARLMRVVQGHRLDGHEPFGEETVGAPVVLSAQSLTQRLMRFLRPGATRFAEYELRELFETSSGVRLVFGSEKGRRTYEIRSRDGAGDASGSRRWVTQGLLALALVEETGFGPGDELLRDYILYALSRGFPVGQEVVSAREWEKRELSGEVEIDVSKLFDGRDEREPWSFFVRPTDRFLGAFDTVGTLLEADRGVTMVAYAHRACTTKMPLLDHPSYVGGMWLRFSPLPITLHRKRVDIPLLAEVDLVLGDHEGVRQEISRALSNPDTRIIAALGTCLGELVGLDLEQMIREENPGKPVTTVMVMARPDAGTPVAEFWRQVFRLGAAEGRRDPSKINLLGFAAEDTRAAASLRRELSVLGLTVNAMVVPSLRTWQIAGFREAGSTLVNRDSVAQEEFRLARLDLGEEEIWDIAPPFGVRGSLQFYREVARHCGVEWSPAIEDALWGPLRKRFEAWKERASAHEAALVMTPEDLLYIEHPQRIYGLDLVALVLEMGFSLRILMVEKDDSGEGISALKTLLGTRDDVVAQRSRVDLERCAPEDFSSRLTALPSDLVFTEYPPDSRVLDSGRMAFHPRDFEMGLTGALSTLIRLVRLAEGRFFKTFGDTAQGGSGS